MAQQDDNIKKLYDELQSTYDVGSEDDFRNYLNNAEHRKALYNELKNDYDIQDEKAFDDYLGYINGEKAPGTTKVGSVAQQVVNEYDQSAKDNAEVEEDLSAATSGAKIGGNISLTPVKANNQQTAQPAVDNTAKSVMDANGRPIEQAKATGPKTQFVPADPNYVQATPTAEALKKYPWMQPDQVYLWNTTTKEPVVSYFDENGQAVTDEDLQIKKAKSEITGQEDTEYMHPEAAALQLPNGNTRGVRLKKGALTQMADEIMRKEYGDNYLNTQFGRDGNVYTGAERRDLGAQQLYDELNSDVRKARISFAVADDKYRNEILSRIKAKWGKVADETSLVNAVNDENAAKQDIDIVAQQNINDLNAEIQNISRQMDQRGAEIDNASSPFVDQTFNARDVDAKYRLLQSKLNYAQNALKSWENVKNSGSLDALAGFKDAVMDISAWDFGFSDLKNSIALLTAKGNDKQELVNLYGRYAEAAKFEDKYNPDSYRYGKIAGTSMPYALQFAGTGGGFKSIGSAVSKKATSIAEKYALEGLKKQVVKGLGVVAGDIARAYTMSGTIQGLNTISDILNRSAGELTVDKQGNYQLKSDEPLLKSIYKGVTASAIENYTEMLGERLNIGGNLMRMLPKIGLGRVSNAITKIGTQDWYRVCNNWLSRAGVNDFGGEVLEEEIGIILNAALVGDNPLFNGSGGLLDVRTQKDILGGMLYSISAMRAGALAMYGVKKGVGSAFIKTLDMYDKMQLNQSDKGGQSIFGEGWAAIKDEIDNTPNEKVNAVIEKLAKEHPSKDEQSAIIDYAVKLLKTRGHNLGIAMASDGENDEGAQEEVQDMPDLSQPNAEYFNKDDGMIHKASLYPDASDPTGTAKDVFIIKGNLVTNEDGSINKDASDDTIIYIDGNGERHIASPDKFAAAYPPMSNDEVQQANEGVTGEGTQTTDTFNKGDEVNINVNGIIYTATIQGTDGSGNYNVYYEDENGMMRPAQFTADQLAAMNSASTASNDKQNMIEQLAGNQQQIEQSAEEQVAQQEQPAQEEQKPAIPTDEKGNMLYHQVPVETTINDLYDGSLDDNEIRDFVDANISEADKNLEKVNKKAPKIGTNKDEYLKKKQEWQKQVEDATRIRDYWNSVKDYIAQQTHTTPEDVKAAQDELSGEAARREYQDMGGSVQQDAVSVASDFIRGAKITPESFKAETGYGTDEQRKFVGMIAKAEKGGKTIDRLAEELVSYDNAEMNGVLFGGDTSSAKDAILSALQGAGTRGELKQTNEAEEQAYIDARNAARDEQYMEQYGMTYEEYLAYEEQIMPTIWREYNNYDEVAFNNMYAEEIEQLIKSIENDTTGEEQADDRGNQVLPEQQVTEQRGSTGSQEQRTEAPVGVQGNNENAVAPEEASGERIPNIERGRQGYTGYIARRQQNNLETSEEINVPLSQNEQDEYGNPMVLAENGSTVFGTIESESGLTEAPIKLSLGENKVGTDGKNHGYGLLHIEAGHGEQIRNAGYQSVEQFVENVAQNYTDIKEGALIGKKQTYLLEVSDEHNNTLFIQLSNDGTYWNVNSAGIFKKKYSRRKPLIYTVPAVGKSTVTDTSEVNSGQSMGATAPAGNSSESKDSDKSAVAQTIDEKIAKAEEETDVNPTEGQKEAGNYKKGHVCIDGYDITIEQPKGSVRRGTDANGKQWEQKMNNTYGYIRGTEGVDGDHIDIFLSDDPTQGNVYVVDQVNPDGSFDEHKVMYGFNSAEDARAAYLSNYEEGWQGLGTITEVSKDEFKKWVNSSKRKTKPFAEYKSVKADGSNGSNESDGRNESNASKEDGGGVRLRLGENGAKPLSAEETAIRDAVVGRLRESGLEVITDAEEGQRVLDEANGKRESRKRKSANNTALPKDESSFKGTVILFTDTANIRNNLETLASDYEKINNPSNKNVISELGRALNATHKGSGSQYVTIEAKNGNIVTIRLADHNVSVERMDNAGRDNAISIVISRKSNEGVQGEGKAHVVEYFYPDKSIRKAGGEAIASIARSLQQALYSGEYKDTTGLAEVEEVNGETIREQRVYHGSGADFEAFDHSHMGEGEGGQVYGWGSYVTEVEGIGRMYAERMAARAHSFASTKFPFTVEHESRDYLKRAFTDKRIRNFEKAREKAIKDCNSALSKAKKHKDDVFASFYKKCLQRITTISEDEYNNPQYRHLYTVEIPDDTGENYLDWSNEISEEQKNDILNSLSKLKNEAFDYDYFVEKLEDYEDNYNLTGEGLYKLLSRYGFDNNYKAASEALNDIGFTGISYPAEYRSGGREDGARNYVIFNEEDLKITDHVHFFRTPNGEAYGFTVGGRIYVDPRVATADTPIHEYAHLWASALRQGNPEEWRNVVGLMKGTPVWDEVRRRYPELTADDDIADEVLATYSGRRGAERLKAETRKAVDGKGVFEAAQAVTAMERVKEALRKFWKGVADFLHIHYTSAEEVADRVMSDLLEGRTLKDSKEHDDTANFARKHNLNEKDVEDYADYIRRGNLNGASRAFKEIRRKVRLDNQGASLGQFAKIFSPIEKELYERFGNIDELRQQYVQRTLDERNAMEAARKKAEEEAEAERRRLQEFQNMSDEQLDEEYSKAVEANDESRMRDLVNEAARRNGYGDVGSEYQGVGAWSAPSNPGYESDEKRREAVANDAPDVNITDIANGYSSQPADYFTNLRAYGTDTPHGRESAKAINNAIDEVKKGKAPMVKVYRAVPKSIKEGNLRNGDWVTPSRKYAEMHGDNRLEGDYRIIEQEVPAGQIWWDGNDINEWGFDDGKGYAYRNTKNNRKLNDPITRDDNGNIIPLSQRFNARKSDIRYRFIGEQGAANLDAAEEATTRLDNLSVAREMENAYNEKKARIEKLKDSKPVDVKYNGEYDLNRKPAKDWLKENVRGEYTNNDTGEKIGISKVGINEVTSHGSQDKAHLKSLIAIPQMIEQSIFIDEIPNTKDHDKYDSYKYYVCGLKIDDVDYIVKLVVGVKGDNKYYDHRLTEIEKGTLIDNLNGLSNSVAENQNANISYGKDTKLQSILQTNDRENARKIKFATGWERGADGMWRYETADFEYYPKGDARRNDSYKKSDWYNELHGLEEKLFNGETLTDEETRRFDELSARVNAIRDNDKNTERIYLDDYVKDEELFKAYPELKQTKIDFVDLPNERYSAKYNEKENRITVNQAKSIDDKSAIAHEVQHAIQHIEGFAQGGNGTEIQQAINQIENKISDILKSDEYKKAINDFGKEYEQKIDKEVENNYSDLEPERKQAIRMAMRDDALIEYKKKSPVLQRLSNLESELNVLRYNPSYKSSYVYNNLSGEVEARNVEARINMPLEERRRTLAEETEDVAREDQIFLQDALGASERYGTYGRNKTDGQKAEEANRRFNEELQQQIDGTLPKGHVYELGRPSGVLRSAGIPNLPIELAASRLSGKSKQDNHPFDMSEVMDLPKAIQNPMAVFRSATHIGSYVVMTEIEHNGKNFVVAIEANRKKGKIEINDIRSIHYRTSNAHMANWISEGLLEYVDKEKMAEWFSKQRYNSAEVRKLFNHAANIVKNFENPNVSDENMRQGIGALTDSELSNANDPAGKMLGKPSRTPAQQKAFAERERQRMADRAREVADILHLDNVEIVTDASTLQGRRAKAKGFYSRDNGKIVIVVPNHVDMADIEQTVLHEAVAHYGLRKLFGSNFDTFLYNVYNNADMDVREKISQLAAQHNWNFATATEEYLASLAEKTNFENLNASWWDKIKSLFLKLLHSIGLKGFTGVSLSDNELRYILWRSYENLKNPGRYRSIIDEAKDITMQNELRVGNYSAGNSEAVGKAAENGVVNIEDVNRRFNEELGRLTEENAQSVILNLGRPGNFLLASGLSDRPIKLYGNKLLKKMRKHGFTTSDVKNLPKEINNPIAVFKGSVENSFAILTELEINGNNVLASISVGKGNDIDFNIISSVYGKNGNSVVSWINDGKILYVNKEKALNYLRISAPIAEAQDNQELSSAANIVKNFENPNISEENMRYGNGALAASESNGINKTNETNGQEAEEANRRFNEELNAFKAKTHKGLLHLGQPGRILNACGINEELTLSPTVLSRKLKQHGLNVDDIKGLAGAIQEPILVYQHGDAHPNMVIVTDLAAKGGKVSVAVELDGEGNVVELNNVSSVHSKGATTELERLSNMRDGYLEQALRWVDKNKVSDWLGIADLNSPIHANNPKLVSIANILQNFENPSVGEENILYREAKKVEKKINSDWRDEYDKKLSKFSFKLTEAAQDAMRSVKILQDIIAKETSAPIRDDENVYWRENRLSSVNKYEQEYYYENYCKPIVTEIANLVKYGARYNDKGEDIINSDNDVLKYLIAKSGLERNQSKREVEAMNARKPYEDQIKELQKQVEKEEIKEENANKKIAKLQEQADKAEMNKRVAVLHKDYSGLTELFQDEKDFDTLATSYVSDFEKKFDTESLWNAINRATKETLRKAFVDGLISRESYESTAKMYKYYIPLRGWANDVASEAYNYKGSGEGSRKILQTAKGRTSLADNPISEIGRMMQDAIFQGNRNRMKQAVYNLAMNHDTSLLNIKRQWYQNMGTEEDPAWERVFPDLNSDMTAEQVAEEVEEFESRMRELKKEGRATQSRKGLILRLHTTKREEAQHRISVAINGKEYNIFVNGNPRAAQAINGELNDVDRYGSAVAKVNRFLSQVYTSINPEFVVTNYQRDAGFAASIVASTEPWSYQKEWAKNMTVYNPITTGVYLNRLIKKAKTGNINPSNKAERYMQEFLSHGGETGFTNMLSADDYKKQIKRDIKSINSVVSLPKAARAAVAFTERVNTVFEDATRYATYVTSREQGRTIDRSIRDAKEISLNFNTRGADGLPGDGFIYRFFRGLRRWMIFVNPSIQGLNKAGMAFRNHPLRSSMMIAGLPTLLGYALPAIMRAVVGGGDGDDDDKNVVESYKDLPKWVRRTNIAIPIVGNNFVTIPLSYELRVSYGLGEMMWEYGEGMIDKDEVAVETLSQLSDLLPVSFSNGTVAQSISPSIARPLIDVIQNRNFYGKKIYNDSQFIEGYPEYMKAYAGTPKWLVKSTEVLNNVIPNLNAGVSDKYTPGAINVNPAIIDYLLSSYLGGLYNFPSKFGKTISMIWDEDMRDIQNVPIVSRNWKNSQSGNPYNSGDRYKTYMKEYDLSKQRFNGYKKEAEHDVPEFLKSLNDLLDTPSGKRMLMIDAYKRDGLDKLNRRIRDIDTYGNEKYEGEKDALTKRRDGLKEELINKLDSISDGTLDFVNGEWTRK